MFSASKVSMALLAVTCLGLLAVPASGYTVGVSETLSNWVTSLTIDGNDADWATGTANGGKYATIDPHNNSDSADIKYFRVGNDYTYAYGVMAFYNDVTANDTVKDYNWWIEVDGLKNDGYGARYEGAEFAISAATIGGVKQPALFYKATPTSTAVTELLALNADEASAFSADGKTLEFKIRLDRFVRAGETLLPYFDWFGYGARTDGYSDPTAPPGETRNWKLYPTQSRSMGYYYPNNVNPDYVNRYVMAVPEPSTVVLLVSGLIGLLAYAWRKRR